VAFRLMCKKYGASMVFSEMIDTEGIINQSLNSNSRLASCDQERPFGIQLSGSSSTSFEKAAKIVEKLYQPDLIDINFGCPARHIVKKGCGAALLSKPQLMCDIVEKVSQAVNVPVTAKLRMYSSYEKTSEVAKSLEEAGVDAITIHSRTQDQNYSHPANLDVIRKLKNDLSIPVIANGDIVDEISAEHVLKYTGCDGIMIGRAAIGNPYIFRRIEHYLRKGEDLEPLSREEQAYDFFDYVNLLDKFNMLDYANIKLHAKWFTKGINKGKSVRTKINAADNIDTIIEIMGEIKDY
jgi:tRNA-dihydrouridine synthase B